MHDYEALKLIHDLQVQRIELESQNEMLLEMRHQLEVSNQKYIDLYDFAPISYFVLNKTGTIQEANLAAAHILNMNRKDVIGKRLGVFVSRESLPMFNHFLETSLLSEINVGCEITLGPVINMELRLDGLAGPEKDCCRVSATNITNLKQAEFRLRHLANHDDLTQLPNRVLLSEKLKQARDAVKANHKPLAVCYLDLDGFKHVNDTLGHHYGDQLLIEASKRLKHCVRENDMVARIGGDEFVLVLEDVIGIKECEQTLLRIVQSLKKPFNIFEKLIGISTSLGVTIYPQDNSSADILLRHADQAMYVAKEQKGNCFHWFDASNTSNKRDQSRFKVALETGEVCLYYQPKVNMTQGNVIGVEALIRWNHPELGLLHPTQFMNLVDTNELVDLVGQWVITQALQQSNRWKALGIHPIISVNISGQHLQHSDFVSQLHSLLQQNPIEDDSIEFEILETVSLDDVNYIAQVIIECRKLGIKFSLDDFGTGYSSLTYLKNLPVHILKIDQSFVKDMLIDADANAIVEGVIGLSEAFHREIIAEGVETLEQGCQLIKQGCKLAQGFFIAEPMKAELIPEWIAQWVAPVNWTSLAMH
jgi:diguanylate cyclase (GGDEF)-like protein